MQKLPIYQVDAFNSELFKGNPAAVVVLASWLPAGIMQKIGMENNLSETAFVVKTGNSYEIRWFTPSVEVDLCGHATLAASKVLFDFYETEAERLVFNTMMRGQLTVHKEKDKLVLDFPADVPHAVTAPDGLYEALGGEPIACYQGITDYMVEYSTETEIANLHPDFAALRSLKARGVIVTAKGDTVDFVSRFFAPGSGIDEDPVTGSAHIMLTPFWGSRLDKMQLQAMQISKRVGELEVSLHSNRVHIAGNAVLYLQGEIFV